MLPVPMTTELAVSHFNELSQAAQAFEVNAPTLVEWGQQLGVTLLQGGRVLLAGNGGSAAEAQHIAAEFTGRLRGERLPLSAIALTADSSAVTAISNDYGYGEVFARQVRAHARPGDIVILLSTSGRSPNLLAAARTSTDLGLRTWAMTGPLPNPLASSCHDVVSVGSADSQVVQELHLVAGHVLCTYVDGVVADFFDSERAHHEPALDRRR